MADDKIDSPRGPEAEGVEKKKEGVVDTTTGVTVGNIERALRDKIEEGGKIEIAGFEGDPKEILKKLQSVLKIVKRYLPFDKKKLFFEDLPGSTVGESTTEGIKADTIMLLHPENRLAHVIFHEISHRGGKVENEGLVEAATLALLKASGLYTGEGDALKMNENYQEALEKFSEFIDRISGKKKDKNKVLQQVYDLYYSGKYDEIYTMYDENYIQAEKRDDPDLDEAWYFFRKVFPELEVSYDKDKETIDDGKFKPRK